MTRALFTAVFLALLSCVHADAAWRDGGHLTAAAAGLGVPHPTGFPLYVVVAHLVSLLPIGSIPFRVALISALAIAGATALVFQLLRAHQMRSVPALLGALCLPASFIGWLNGTLAEVYALNAFVLAFFLYDILRPKPHWKRAAFTTGLGLGGHVTFPLIAGIVWVVSTSRHKSWREFPRWIPRGVFGALVLGVLPLLAGREPWLNWGDASTFSGWLSHVTASGITDAFGDQMGASAGDIGVHSVLWAQFVGGRLYPLAFGVLLVGGFFVKHRGLWLTCVLALVADGVFSVVINPMGQADLQTALPGVLLMSLTLGLVAGGDWASKMSNRLVSAVALVAVIAVLAGHASTRIADRPADDHAGWVARHTLVTLPPGATVFLTGDDLPSQFLYLQGVENLRLDVLPLVIQHLPNQGAVEQAYRAAKRPIPQAYLDLPADPAWNRIRALIRAEGERSPVFWMLGDHRMDKGVYPFIDEALVLARLSPKTSVREGRRVPDKRLWDRIVSRGDAVGFRTRRFFSERLRLSGTRSLLAKRLEAASKQLEAAVAMDVVNARALVNLAALRFRQGKKGEAVELLRRAIDADPTYRKARENLSRYATGEASR